MEHTPEETLRSLLQQTYHILEQYSNELERPSVKEERIEEILAQVKNLATHSVNSLLNLISINSDPVQSECLESSLVYLQYAIKETQAPPISKRKTLKLVLYHSRMALLCPWGGFLLWFPIY